MKLLLVAEAFVPRFGGGVRYEKDIVEHFRGYGHVVDVVTVGHSLKPRCWQEIGGSVYELPKHLEFSSARLSVNMFSFLLQRIDQYDLLHFNSPNPIGEFSYWAVRALRRKIDQAICSYHGEVVSSKRFHRVYNSWLLLSHLRACQRLIVSSPNIVQTTPLLNGFQHKVEVIPYGIDTARFTTRADWSPAVPVERPLSFLFVGRLVRYKGLQILLHSIAQTRGTLKIIGDGPLRPQLTELVRKLGLTERVQFYGAVSDRVLIENYQHADVIVLPSVDRGESFGYVLAEGMACGACAISTELGTGTSFVNIHDVTGKVVSPGDPQELKAAMVYLDEHRTELARYRSNAPKRVKELFSREEMLKKTSTLYESLGMQL
jgi:rhamnosyl/mannosyltransferase